MKTLHKQAYTSPFVEIYEPSQADVLNVSTFNTKDDHIGNDKTWDFTSLTDGN